MKRNERLTPTTDHRVPAATPQGRKDTEEFLMYFHHRINRSIDAMRQLKLDGDSAYDVGQLAHFKKALQVIKWLMAMNTQRRNDA